MTIYSGNLEHSSSQEQQLRYLSQSIRLKESTGPAIVRGTVAILSLSVLAFIGWTATASVYEVARTPGEIIPGGYQQVVQNLEGGIVQSIPVHDGDMVEKGQTVLVFDDTDAKTDLDRAIGKKNILAMQEERLRAFIEGRKPDFSKYKNIHPELADEAAAFLSSMNNSSSKDRDVVNDQIRQKKQSIFMLAADLKSAKENYAITQNLYSRRAELNRQGIFSDVKLLETEQRRNELQGQISSLSSQIGMAQSALKEYQSRLTSLSASQTDDAHKELDAVLAEEMQNDEMISKLKNRVDRLTVTAPVRGIVKSMGINTVGSVVQPGQALMEIVPTDEAMIVSLKIPPKYIGHIKKGQPVQVKLSSYDFARYGAVGGTLQSISATTFDGENGERYYQGKVALNKNYVGNNPENKVLPGMTVMADVITGDKTILQYLLKPVQTALSSAFTER